MKKDPRVYLAQILERIERILQYTAGGKEAFFADPLQVGWEDKGQENGLIKT